MKNKEGWEIKKLGEVCNFQNGFAFKSEFYKKNGLPILRISNIQNQCLEIDDVVYFDSNDYKENFDKYKVLKGDLVIAMSGATTGKLGINKTDTVFYLNQRVGKFIPKIKLSNKFLYYFLSTRVEESLRIAAGVAQPNISTTQINEFIIPIPPLPIQHQIVTELDTLSDIISKKKQQIEELDKLAQATFYDMFGDPVTNEKGWETGKIGDIVKSVNYGTSSPSIINGKYKYLRMNNLTYGGQINLSDLKFINVENSNYEKYVARKGDILFNRTNSKELVGKTICFLEDEEMIIAGYLIRVRVNKLFNPIFVSYYMNTHYIKVYLKNLCKNIIGMANINAKELQSIPIYFPPILLQNQFATKIESIENQKALINQSIGDVQQLFDYTMDKYFV